MINRNKIFYFLLGIILFLMAYTASFSARENTSGLSAYEGLHFMVGFMQNEYKIISIDDGIDLNIFIATKELANIRIQYPDGKKNVFQMGPDTLHQEIVSTSYECRDTSEAILHNGISIDSDVPLTVYCFSSQDLTSDSYSAIPVTNWGHEYIVVSQPNNYYDEKDQLGNITKIIRNSEFMVLASYDDTKVKILLSEDTKMGKKAGDSIEVTLNKGDCYLVKSADNCTYNGDLTGTKVLGDKPISVLSGHVRAPMPTSSIETTRDHLVEMLLPTSFWGNQYVSIPFGVSDAGDYIRIVSAEPNVNIECEIDGKFTAYEIKNDKLFVEIEGVQQPAVWRSDKPVQLAQIMGHVDPEANDWKEYDPCMAMLPPREQFVQYVMFQTPGNVFKKPNQYLTHYVSIVMDEEAIENIKLDNVKIDSAKLAPIVKINDTENLYMTRLELSKGKHSLVSEKGYFAGVLYGTGSLDSYAMVLGASLREPGVIDSLPPVFELEKDCSVYEVVISDKEAPNKSGLLYAQVNEMRTNNFEYVEHEYKLEDTTSHITATVIDPYKDARITIYGQDRAGNRSEVLYLYKATQLVFPETYDFGTVFWHESPCIEKILFNKSNKPFKVLSARVEGDERVFVNVTPSLPYELDAKEEMKFEVCFSPNFDSTSAEARLILELDCDIDSVITIIGEVKAPLLSVKGHEFGKVLIGTSITDSLRIKNKGNININLTEIHQKDDTTIIVIDDQRIPAIIAPTSDFYFPVTFTPLEVKEYSIEGMVANSADIDNRFYFTGEGAAPILNSLTINLLERRIGSQFDTTFSINNKGNWEADLTFDRFLGKTETGPVSDYLSAFGASGVAEGDDITFTIPARIDNIGNFEVTADYKQISYLLDDIEINIVGVGTMPEIETKTITFADTDIYSQRDTNAVIYTAGGNEKLHILSVTVLKTDPAFSFDLSTLNDTYINPGEDYKFEIDFYPTFGGTFYADLLVESDAAPNYASKFDTIHIIGSSRVPDVENIIIELFHDPFLNCVEEEATVRITNLDTSPVNLDSIYLYISPEESEYTFLDNIINEAIPTTLKTGEYIEFEILLDLKSYTTTNLTVELVIFETVHLEKTFPLTPASVPMAVMTIPRHSYQIGKIYAMNFKGTFPYAIKEEVFFTCELNLSAEYFYIEKDTTYYLNINGEQIELKMQQEASTISFSTVEKLTLNEGLTWEFSFEFLALLNSSIDFNLICSVFTSDCYDEFHKDFDVEFEDICVRDIRSIQIVEIPEIAVSPNPTAEKVEIFIKSKLETDVQIDLFDINGKKKQKSSFFTLLCGKNVLNYNLNTVPNGNYYLMCSIDGYKEIKLIIINK